MFQKKVSAYQYHQSQLFFDQLLGGLDWMAGSSQVNLIVRINNPGTPLLGSASRLG